LVATNNRTTCLAAPLAPISNLADRLGKVRRRLVALTCMVIVGLLFTAAHEIFVLFAPSVPFPHHAVHISMVVMGVSIAAGLWIFWGSYRSLNAYQKLLANGYAKLDLTVQEKTQDLLASKSLLESLFDAVKDRVVAVDRLGAIVHANRQAIADAGEDPRGILFSRAFPPCEPDTERRSELRIINYTFRTRMPQRNRLVKGGKGCSRVLEINTYPVTHETDEVKLVLELVRDVTQDREDGALANHYEKMAALGLLAGSIAHDLGNPLASISSELQMLRQEHSIERMHQSLQTLERHIERMVVSVREILGFAHTRSDRSERASVRSTAEDSIRLLRHDPRAKSVRFQVDVPIKAPHVAMKEDDLVLILLNVLVNAIDAMPKGGRITISCQDAGREHLVLAVEDTGTGMDSDTLARATQPLFTTKAGANGTGLGLAIASMLIHRVNGALSISSVPGKGTTVTLQLPLRRVSVSENDQPGANHRAGTHSDH